MAGLLIAARHTGHLTGLLVIARHTGSLEEVNIAVGEAAFIVLDKNGFLTAAHHIETAFAFKGDGNLAVNHWAGRFVWSSHHTVAGVIRKLNVETVTAHGHDCRSAAAVESRTVQDELYVTHTRIDKHGAAHVALQGVLTRLTDDYPAIHLTKAGGSSFIARQQVGIPIQVCGACRDAADQHREAKPYGGCRFDKTVFHVMFHLSKLFCEFGFLAFCQLFRRPDPQKWGRWNLF